MSRQENIAAIRAAGKEAGQGFLLPLVFRIYAEGSKSHRNPYVLFGLEGAPAGANLSCHSEGSLWQTLMAIGASPEPEAKSVEEEMADTLSDAMFESGTHLVEDGEVALDEIAVGDIVKHRDGKHRLAVARLDSGWKLRELRTGKELSGWAYTTKVTRMKVVPA